MRPTRAVIHLDYLKENIRNIKKFVREGVRFCVAVKADAYGHGAVPCAKAALEAGADWLAVATVAEGIELRENGISCPVIMLSLCGLDEIEDAVRYRITPFVFDREYVQEFAEAASKAGARDFPVHIAVDSGMGRIGCYPEEAGGLAEFIVDSGLRLEGMATHFAVSDCAGEDDLDYTKKQYERFLKAVENVKAKGIDPGICHCSNSAAAILHPDFNFGMVRNGITVYGYYPGDFTKKILAEKGLDPELKPVMTLETKVSAIRDMKKGMSVGYGRTWTAEKDTRIAVLPVGYADGVVRNFSTSGAVISINGKKFPIVGRICMDQLMVDLGDDMDVRRWDKAVIFGASEDGALQDADDIARKTGTISYEITSCITKRVERVFVS